MLLIERLGDVERVRTLLVCDPSVALTQNPRQLSLQKNKPMRIFGKTCWLIRKVDQISSVLF